MKHAVTMRVIQRFSDLDRVANGLARRQRAASEPRRERLSLDVLHDQEGRFLLAADVVQRADVRVVQRGDEARLAFEAGPAIDRRERSAENLQRDRAVDPRVARLIDLPHPALPTGAVIS